jgi:hypothetical protein
MKRSHQTAFLLFGMAFLAERSAALGIILLAVVLLVAQIVEDRRDCPAFKPKEGE